MEKLRTEREQFIEDVRRQETAIRQRGEEVKSAVDRKVDELLEELERIKTDSLNCAQAAETRLQQTADTAQTCCENLQEVQTNGGPHDVARYATAIDAQATHLLDQRVTGADYTSPCVLFIPTHSERVSTRHLLGHIATPLSSSGFVIL